MNPTIWEYQICIQPLFILQELRSAGHYLGSQTQEMKKALFFGLIK